MTRLVVVGGGILGTMHALYGLEEGFEVLHLERDATPRGASVRNFGLIWVSGRAAGPELDLALEARRLWESIGSRVKETGFRPAGSLTVARSDAEWGALKAAASAPDADRRGLRLLDERETRGANPALRGELLGSLHCTLDAVVEPRLALGALRAELSRAPRYRYLPGTAVRELIPEGVVDDRGEEHHGDLVVCCTGASPGGAIGEALSSAPLRRVQLQMLETEPYPHPVPTALADGDSLRYYPAYATLREGLEAQREPAASWRAQLLLVKRLSGHLTVGDTHAYDEPFAFDLADEPTNDLLGAAAALFGGALPSVERRWKGVYSEVTDPELLYYRAELAPGVLAVTGPGGRGMTMSPAIAAATFASR